MLTVCARRLRKAGKTEAEGAVTLCMALLILYSACLSAPPPPPQSHSLQLALLSGFTFNFGRTPPTPTTFIYSFCRLSLIITLQQTEPASQTDSCFATHVFQKSRNWNLHLTWLQTRSWQYWMKHDVATLKSFSFTHNMRSFVAKMKNVHAETTY